MKTEKKNFPMRTTMMLLLMVLTSLSAWADDSWTSGDCTVALTGNTLTVSKKSGDGNGAMADYTSANDQPWYSSRNSITKVIIEDGVTHLGDHAFQSCRLQNVIIPASVTSIGESAFANNSMLSRVNVLRSESVTTLGTDAFKSCNNSLKIYVLSKVDEYKSAWSAYDTKIMIGGFCGDSGDNVIWAYDNGTLTISGTDNMASYNSADDQPWKDYRLSITSVVIENDVTSIGNYAFADCTNLASVTVHAEYCNLGNNAFAGCTNLANIYVLSNYVYSYQNDWSDYASIITVFGYCGSFNESDVKWVLTGTSPNYTLTIMKVGSTGNMALSQPWQYFNNEITSVVIENGVTSIGGSAFQSCKNLTTVTIPASVESIGSQAFDGCENLTSVTIPASVTSIGQNAFTYCSNLATIIVDGGNTKYDSRNGCNAIIEKSSNTLIAGCKGTIIPDGADGVTNIGRNAFCGSGLTSITIPASVTSIGNSAFYACSHLAAVTFASVPQLETIESGAFNGCTSLPSITIPSSVTSIGQSAFYGCTSLTSVTIPANVTSIESYVFNCCTSLTSVNIPASVESIGNNAFCQSGLTSITIPASVTSIGYNVFGNCSNLATITVDGGNTKYDSRNNCNAIIEKSSNTLIAGCQNTAIPSSVTSIGDYAFSGRTGLTSIDIPATVTSIGNYAFHKCFGLTSVIFHAESLTTYGSNAFDNNNTERKIYVPSTAIDAYQTGWSAYKDDIVAITESGNCGDTNVHNGADVTWTLTGTSSNYTLTISGTGAMADYNTDPLPWASNKDEITDIIIQDGVTSIGAWAFGQCVGLKSVTIPATVTSIGEGAFNYCNNLKSVSIPATVTSIGAAAFNGCASLTSVMVYASPTCTLGAAAFQECPSLQIYVPAASLETYKTKWSAYKSKIVGAYTITFGTLPNCVTGVATPSMAAAYETVTLSFSGVSAGMVPALSITYGNNYEVFEIKDNGDGTFSFPMPNDNVTVNCGSELKDDIKLFTPTVPDQMVYVDLIWYKFEAANYNPTGNVIGETVIKGNTKLVLGTDYEFKRVTYANGDPGDPENTGDECLVEIKGINNYGGSLYAPFTIVNPSDNGTWGDNDELTWDFADGTLNITLTDPAIGNKSMKEPGQNTNYPWLQYAGYISNITIGEGVTTIAASAFAGNGTVNPYSSVTSVTLPSTLETICDYAFAYSGLTSINIPASVTSIGDGAFNQCTSLTSITLSGGVTIGGAAFPTTTNTNTTVTIANGLYLHNGTEILSGNVTDMSKLNDKTLRRAVTTSYVDASGTLHENIFAISLDNTMTTLDAGWYVVNSDISYDATLTLGGDVNVILCDGKTMNVGTATDRIASGNSINAGQEYSLTIYGQALQTGTLNAFNSDKQSVYLKNYIQHGGNVTIDATNDDAIRLYGNNLTLTRGTLNVSTTAAEVAISFYNTSTGIVTVSGGNLTATSNYSGIYGNLNMSGGTVSTSGDTWAIYKSATISCGTFTATGDINGSVIFTGGTATINGNIWSNATLGWTNATDYIRANSYGGTVTIADGQNFLTDDATPVDVNGTITDVSTIAGKKLQPAVPYIDADGTTAYCADFTVIDENYDFGSGTTATIGVNNDTEQWFVVKGTVNVGKPVIVNGNSRIILCDGATLNVTGDDSYYAAFSGPNSKNLTIYGQSAGTGTLNVQNATGTAISARVSSITINGGTIIANSTYNVGFDITESTAIINGGTVTAKGTGTSGSNYASGFFFEEGGSLTVNGGAVSAESDGYGIHFEDGSLTINNGTVSTTGDTQDIYMNYGNLVFGWTSGNDRSIFTATKYDINEDHGSVKIADGKTLYNGTETLSGTLYDYNSGSLANLSKVLGKTLQPYIEWEGTGTENDPWVIEYPSQLDLLARRVNSGTNGETANTYEGKYFKLGADITFDYDASEGDDYAENYEAIGYCYGTTYHPFGGNFNGDGHTISGIRLRKEGTDEADRYQGLFGVIGSGANIHHVHVTAARIKGLNHVGGIVGWNAGGTVSNCTVTESVITATKNDYYGTICGVSHSTNLSHNYYYGCTVNGTASATNVGCNGADVTTNDGAVHVNGTCGDTGVNGGADVTWSYDTNTKALTISGTGQMMYYGSALGGDSQYHSTAPWSAYDSEIETVVVNNGVTYIGSYAFAYCSALTSISLPASVVALGDYVCYGSSNGSTNLRIDIPSVVAVTIGAGGFDATPANLKIAVPAELLDDYQVATNWSGYAAKMVGVLSETTGFGTTFATGNYEYKRTFNCGVAATLCLPFAVASGEISPYGKVYTFDGVDKTTEPKWTVVMREEDPSNRVTGNLEANKPYLFMPYILDGKSKGDPMPITFTGEVTKAENAGYASWSEGSAGAYWTFQGVYYNVAWNKGDANLGKVYGFAAQSYEAPDDDNDNNPDYIVSPGDFVKAAAGASIAPFRAFLQFTPSSSAQRRGAADNEVLPSSMSVRLVDADGIVTAIGTIDTKTGEVSFDSDAWYTLDGRRLNGKPIQKGVYIKNGKKILVK